MDQKKGQAVRVTKGLGSTSNYLGDYEEDYMPKRDEKVAFVKDPEEEEKKRASKDKALVKYNFSDFLN
jgi:hypothetical protein